MFHFSTVCSNICPICQQSSECPMQRTMLAAVYATEEQLNAPWYMIQISAHLAFSYTKCESFASLSTCHILDASQSKSDLQ